MDVYLNAVVTLAVGFVALFVYLRQKKDYKKDAANILIMEIESAERQLDSLRSNGPPKALKDNQFLMPSSSWSKYRHLFARDFIGRELDIVTNFYNKCSDFDEAVKYNGTFFGQDVEVYRSSINRVMAQAALEIAKEDASLNTEEETVLSDEAVKKYLQTVGRAIKLYMDPKNMYVYGPQRPIDDAIAALASVDAVISTSTVGVKLRRIAKQSLVQRIFTKNI